MIHIIKSLRLILDYKQRSRIVILFIMMLFGALLEAGGIALLPVILTGLMNMEDLNQNSYLGFICSKLECDIQQALTALILFLILLYAFKGIYILIQYYCLYCFINNNRYKMQSQLMQSYLNRDYSYYMRVRSGDVIQNLTNNVDFVFTAVTSLMNFTSELVMVIILLITILVINPLFSLGIGGLLFLLILMVGHFIKPVMVKAGNQINSGYKNMNKWILQSVRTLFVLS